MGFFCNYSYLSLPGSSKLFSSYSDTALKAGFFNSTGKSLSVWNRGYLLCFSNLFLKNNKVSVVELSFSSWFGVWDIHPIKG